MCPLDAHAPAGGAAGSTSLPKRCSIHGSHASALSSAECSAWQQEVNRKSARASGYSIPATVSKMSVGREIMVGGSSIASTEDIFCKITAQESQCAVPYSCMRKYMDRSRCCAVNTAAAAT